MSNYEKFDTNPSAKTLFRDMPRVVSTLVASASEMELGASGVRYDTGHIIDSIFRPVCKLIVIPTVTYLTAAADITLTDTAFAMIDVAGHFSSEGGSPISFSVGGRVANYICEPMARFFVVVEQDKQHYSQYSHTTNVSYVDYIQDHFDATWLAKAGLSIFSKVMVADALGEVVIKNLGCGQALQAWIAAPVNSAQLAAIQAFTGTSTHFEFEYTKGIWSKLSIALSTTDNLLHKTAMVAGIALPQIAGKYVEEYIMTYLLSSHVRIISDMGDDMMDVLLQYSPTEGAMKESLMTPELYPCIGLET